MEDNNNQQKEPKQRILDSAARLFAQKGYSAVGVREISKNANVNISMISYYFGGKPGILKSIIEGYFIELSEIVKKISRKNFSPENSLNQMIKNIVKLFRSKPDFCKVAIIEMPLEIPEISEFKVEMLKRYLELIKESFHTIKPVICENKLQAIIGPAFISLVYSNFFFGDIIKSIHELEFNDEFYELYVNTITNLYLNGVRSFAKELQ